MSSTKAQPAAAGDYSHEAAFVAALRQGDADAYEQLLQQFEEKIYKLAFRFTRNTADAEEVVQNVFLQIFRKIGEFQGNSALSSWIYRVTANAALMLLRKNKNSKVTDSLEDALPEYLEDGHAATREPAWNPLPDERVLSQQVLDRIDAAAGELPPEYRIVFVLRDIEGMSNEEVAEALNLSVAAVKSRLHRARLYLRKQLAPEFEKKA